MKAYPYTPQAGDVAWIDYIPVKFVSEAYQEGTYNQKGFVAIDIIATPTGKQAWVDYVPIVIDDTRTDAWLVNRVGYIPVNYSGTGDGSAANKGLSLNFLGADRLDPRITFSRASNATVTRADGTIGFAPHNLFTHSEQFDNSAVWALNAATVSANSAVAPNGTTTADKLIVTNGQTAGYIIQPTSLVAGVTYTYTVYAKDAGFTSFRLLGQSTAFGSNQTGLYNLTTGVASVTSGTPTVSIENVGDGWYRCRMTVTATTTTTDGVQLRISAITGDGTSGIFLWGAQLNVGSLQPYYPTTVKNLLGFSEAFDNAAWTKTNASVTANTTATAAPNGTFTADKLVSAASTSTQLVQQAPTTINTTPSTYSIYVKAAEYTFVRVRASEGSPFNRAVFIDVNLTTGATVRTNAVNSAVLNSSSVTDVGNGWYRIAINFTLGGSATTTVCQAYLNNGTDSFNITGNGTSGIYIWGAQLSDSASLDTYVNNPVAAPTAAAYYGPRFDYDPVTLQPRGLLIEEQRTNLLLRSEEFNDSYWTKENTTATTNAAISPDGTQDAESIVSGTSGTMSVWRANIGITANTTHTASVYVKAGTGLTSFSITLTNGALTNGVTSLFNLATGVVTSTTVIGAATNTGSTIEAVGNGWYRVSARALFDATATMARVNFILGQTSATAFLWGAQLEAGAFATSYIPTTASQVTRSADVALIQGSNFSGWYNVNEGTVATTADQYAPSSTGFNRVFQIDDNTNNNTIAVMKNNGTSSQFFGYVSVGGVGQASLYTTSVTANTAFKTALAYKVNDFAFSFNGATPSTDTSGTIPTVTQMTIGSGSSTPLNGHIRSLAYYPRRLSNTELQAVTA